MNSWTIFVKDQTFKKVSDFEPLLAQWEKNTHPAQIRLYNYLDWLAKALKPLPKEPSGLYLYLEVDVQNPNHLLHHHDLENYLTPIFNERCLDHQPFVLISAKKKVGGDSFIEIGSVRQVTEKIFNDHWGSFECAPNAGTSTKQWKEILHSSLEKAHPSLMTPGPVEVNLAWRCSPRRNWVNLWKPTGDAMGPVLGYSSQSNLFNPQDDRIISLSMHKSLDSNRGNMVDVGMWWRNCTETNTP